MPNRVRPGNTSHICELIRIAEETNLNPWTAQNYIDELQTNNSIILVLEDESVNVIGFIVGRIVPGGSDGLLDAEIYNIGVTEAEQGQGNGQILLSEFLKRCDAADVINIWLEVRESNRNAIDFYCRNGFEPVQKRSDFYKEPREHAIVMRYLLEKKTA